MLVMLCFINTFRFLSVFLQHQPTTYDTMCVYHHPHLYDLLYLCPLYDSGPCPTLDCGC